MTPKARLYVAIGLVLLFGMGSEEAMSQGAPRCLAVDLSDWQLKSFPRQPRAGETPADIGRAAGEAVPGYAGQPGVQIRWEQIALHWWGSYWELSRVEPVAVRPEETLTVAAWLKGNAGLLAGEVFLDVLAEDDSAHVLAQGTGERVVAQDVAVATSEWQQLAAVVHVPEGCTALRLRFRGSHRTDLVLGDVEITLGAPAPAPRKPRVEGSAPARLREKLDRGVVATPCGARRTHLSWRLLESDTADAGFHVYRQDTSGEARCLTSQPVVQTTDYLDTDAPAGPCGYFVRRVTVAGEEPPSETAPADPGAPPYRRIKLQGEDTVQNVAVGDLDGDGRLEFVVKRPAGNIDPAGQWHRTERPYFLEAYREDGTRLWRYDMGWAIEGGIWFAPYVVFDLDGDGCAEVVVKAGEGDPREPDGHVLRGPEYVRVLDGRTGAVRAQTPWPSREGFTLHNTANRNQLGVAYLDGKTPFLIVERGTYDTIKLVAYELRGDTLHEAWRWCSREDGLRYHGQGAHSFHAADVDGDGRDEIIYGAAVVDDNGQGLWSAALAHVDHVSVGQLDPTRPGLQIHYGCEHGRARGGLCQVDARTGEVQWELNAPTTHVHSAGLTANLDPAHPGAECYGKNATGDGHDGTGAQWLISAQGEVLSTEDLGGFAPRAAYWDGDLQRELLCDGRLVHYASGRRYEPQLEGQPLLIADLLGDWREEIVTALPGELRLYTTTIPATDRRVCLLRDPIYRLDLSGVSSGYIGTFQFQVLPRGSASG